MGRVVLLAIAHRKITIFRSHDPKRRARKTTCQTILNTPGDLLRSKRLEKGLRESQVARMLGAATQLVKDWEANLQTPSQAMLTILAGILGLTEFPNNLKPTPE